MNSSKKESPKSKNKNNLDPNEKNSFNKVDIIGKIILGILGLVITFFIQYHQFKLSKNISDFNQKLEETKIRVVEGQLASTLIENIVSGEKKEQRLACAILETTAPDTYTRILEAISFGAEDEQTRKQAIVALGNKGDKKSIQVLNKIAESKTSEEERKAAIVSRKRLYFRMTLRNARAFYDIKHYSAAVGEFQKLKEIPADFDVDKKALTLARLAESKGDHRSAAQNYMEAFRKVYLTFK